MDTFTIREAADACNTGYELIRKRVDRGTLRTEKHGGIRHVTRAELERAGLWPGSQPEQSGDHELLALRQQLAAAHTELAALRTSATAAHDTPEPSRAVPAPTTHHEHDPDRRRHSSPSSRDRRRASRCGRHPADAHTRRPAHQLAHPHHAAHPPPNEHLTRSPREPFSSAQRG